MKAQQNIFWAGLAILVFLGALFWAKGRDPFCRRWFALKTADHSSFMCVAVLPKPSRQYPIVIYAHDSGSTLMNDGQVLRQMAEMGLATISFEYHETTEASFATQFQALLRYLDGQKWADTNAIAWVGFSSGANQMLDFALQHPERQPALLALLSGRGLDQSPSNTQVLTNLHCPVLLIHGDQDEIFPVADTRRLASVLQSNEVPVELKTIPGVRHQIEPERGLVFRNIGEYCLTHLAGKDAWQHYRSISQWQSEAPSLWLFWTPAAVWIVGWLASHMKSRDRTQLRIPFKRGEIITRWLAVILAILALAEMAIHMATPNFSVSNKTLDIARRFLVQPKERADFEFLAEQPIWKAEKLETLLDDVELVGYNRGLINWKIDDKTYRDDVLSPVITGIPGEQLNWRRLLWEEFYPRIRHERSLEDAAAIVVRHLRERVTIADISGLPREVPQIWLKQMTDGTGFKIIYVATLRSVGIPARLSSSGYAEIYIDGNWRPAPQPAGCLLNGDAKEVSATPNARPIAFQQVVPE